MWSKLNFPQIHFQKMVDSSFDVRVQIKFSAKNPIEKRILRLFDWNNILTSFVPLELGYSPLF